MSQTDSAFTGSIPETYEQYLVPLIFEAYADDLARRVGALKPARVLETAAGTGVVTRRLAAQLSADACYLATDLNQAMIDFAKTRVADAKVGWQQADAQTLAMPDASVDVVVCQFGVMFFPDRVKAYGEARRVLAPGGAFIFNVWGDLASNPIPAVASAAVSDLFPGRAPNFLARTPYAYNDFARIRSDLAAAGFGNVKIETVDHESRAAHPSYPAIGFCRGSPLMGEIAAYSPDAVDRAVDHVTRRIGERFGTAGIAAPMRAHVVTART